MDVNDSEWFMVNNGSLIHRGVYTVYIYICMYDRPLGTILFGLVLMFLALLKLQCF